MVLREDELADWRRTCYSSEITPKLKGKKITVFGWVASIRRQGGITFLILRDKEGMIQVTLRKDVTPSQVLREAERLRPHSSVGIRGVVRSIKKAPHGAELIPEEVKVLGLSRRLPPFSLYSSRLPSIDKRLNSRPIDLRRPKVRAIFMIRHVALAAIRDFLTEKGYIEVNTPKIIATATEGGAALFPLLYYDKEAFLSQSPQLYKEQLIMAFEKVFEVGSAFRAEQSRTLEHLSEFVSVDVEEAYVDYHSMMETVEQLTRHIARTVRGRCMPELELLGRSLEGFEAPFRRLKYDEALELLSEDGIHMSWGEDFSAQALRSLEKMFNEFYFVIDWPTHSKPFYIKPFKGRPELCEAFDLMHGAIEVASGGSRVSSKRLLIKRLKEKGLKPKSFEHHLKVFDYGMPPHAGFGLGLERLLMVITGLKNIRDTTAFPRDQFRLTP